MAPGLHREKPKTKALVFGWRDDGKIINIGGELVRRAPQKGYEIVAMVTSKAIHLEKGNAVAHDGSVKRVLKLIDDLVRSPDVVFNALPPMGRGEVSSEYALFCLEQEVPVVFADKRAMAYNAEALSPYYHLMGVNATVGGNSRIIANCLARSVHKDDVLLEMVINGTMNFVLTLMQEEGETFARAMATAAKLGYAEPDDGKGHGPFSGFLGELTGDIPSKVAAFHNRVCYLTSNRFITPDAVKVHPFTEHDLRRVTDGTTRFRYLVEMSNAGNGLRLTGKEPGSFRLKSGPWQIGGGFVNMPKGTPLGDWVPNGVRNGMRINYIAGHNSSVDVSAHGAGAGPTTDTMFQDAEALLRRVRA